jgi:hypothetical protein
MGAGAALTGRQGKRAQDAESSAGCANASSLFYFQYLADRS